MAASNQMSVAEKDSYGRIEYTYSTGPAGSFQESVTLTLHRQGKDGAGQDLLDLCKKGLPFLTGLQDSEDQALLAKKTESDKRKEIDVGVVVALPDEEQALRCVTEDWMRIPSESFYPAFHTCSIPTNDEKPPISLCVGRAGMMGNVDSAATAMLLMQYFRPKVLAAVGIAGGFDHKGVKIGDIIVANGVHAWEYSKISETERPRPRPFTTWEAARRITEEWMSGERLPPRYDTVDVKPESTLRCEMVASGLSVIGSAEKCKEITSHQDMVHAVEMEAEGLCVAAKYHPDNPHVLVVRGISDLADVDKNDKDRSYAHRIAAAVFRDLVLRLYREGHL